MLQRLHIRNYAIIESLTIDFSGKLNIITGETGAGKSILMGALNLVLGQRADSMVLLDNTKKCIVEAAFGVRENNEIKKFLAENDLDPDDDIFLRREIAANGKSRSFVNDTPVNLSQLKTLAVMLVDLHQQFDTLELSAEGFQRNVIDALGDNSALLRELGRVFSEYVIAKKALEALVSEQADANKELDYNRFLFEELDDLSLKEDELENLEIELRLLSNAETIKQQLGAVYYELKDSDQPIVQQLKVLQQKIHSLEQYQPALPVLYSRLQSTVIELADIADELESVDAAIHHDPQRIQEVNDRMAAGYKLLKKHGVTTTAELVRIKNALQHKLDNVLNIASAISEAAQRLESLHKQAVEIAEKISANRKKQVTPFVEKVNKLLVQVGMPNARLKVSISQGPLCAAGTDEIAFLFDANKSNRFEPLHKVASGGELSRLMLSVKSLVAAKLQLPTLIFDEIDTGISGEAARQVGIIMKDLTQKHQLIAITHQPQIAAKASAHYFVFKAIENDKIVTSIRLLNADERITAIAQMLSGEKPTAAALQNAREMVGN